MRNICKTPDCERYVAGQGLCDMHYRQMRRAQQDETCTVPGCARALRSVGMCSIHYSRLRVHGSVAWAPPRGGYTAVHQALKKSRGPARNYQCVTCGERAYDWSYDNDDPDEITDDRGRRYTWNLERYAPRCRSCHFTRDGHVRNLGDYALTNHNSVV